MNESTAPARLTRMADLLDEADADARARNAALLAGTHRGPATGLSQLDHALGGALAPGLHAINGEPGAGKSALLLQIASTCGCPALVVTCEMRPLVLLKRLTARVTGTYLGRFDSGELTPEQAGALYRRAAAAAPTLAILDATHAPAPTDAILTAAEATCALPSESNHLLVCVDSLHSWADGLAGELPEYDRLNAAISGLRALAHNLVCPVLYVAERNRAGMKAGGMASMAGTRKLEYGAESVLDLALDDDDRDTYATERAVKLKLTKNRNGAAGRELCLAFSGREQRFSESTR